MIDSIVYTKVFVAGNVGEAEARLVADNVSEVLGFRDNGYKRDMVPGDLETKVRLLGEGELQVWDCLHEDGE